MAGFAASRCSIGAGSLHTVFELSLVRIGMAAGTGQFIPMICNRLWFEAVALLVAIAARDCHVAARKGESGFLMTRQRKGGWPIRLQIVAALTGVEVRCSGKLSRMFVTVAVSAALELDFELRILAPGNVAAGALHDGVSTLQGIRRSAMVFYCERGWLEPIHGMARGTLAAVTPLGKLAGMRIGPVTVHALLKNQRLLKISSGVALRAFDSGMFSQQRVLGLGMVEALDDRLGRDSLPAAGVVACLTALGEASAMGIGVAIRTLAKSDAGIARLAVRSGRMTFLAGDLGMRTSQGIARLRVVELADGDGFPVVVGVALQTIFAQPSFVLVLMTSHATCGNPEESLIRIGNFDGCAFGRRDVLGAMAAVAGQSRVFALEGVSGLLVVERADVPLDEGKVLSVMLRVAANAFLARA